MSVQKEDQCESALYFFGVRDSIHSCNVKGSNYFLGYGIPYIYVKGSFFLTRVMWDRKRFVAARETGHPQGCGSSWVGLYELWSTLLKKEFLLLKGIVRGILGVSTIAHMEVIRWMDKIVHDLVDQEHAIVSD